MMSRDGAALASAYVSEAIAILHPHRTVHPPSATYGSSFGARGRDRHNSHVLYLNTSESTEMGSKRKRNSTSEKSKVPVKDVIVEGRVENRPRQHGPQNGFGGNFSGP
jgi:hypothetical protein